MVSNKKQVRVLGLCTIAIALLAIVGFIVAKVHKKTETLHLKICTVKLPKNWICEIPNGGKTMLYFQGLQEKLNVQDDILENSSGGLSYEPELTKEELKKKPLYKFPVESGAEEGFLEIDGKKIHFLRYVGLKYISEGGVVLESEFPTVTITLYSDFGFYGAFFGFPEEETGFWEMIESIRWEKEGEMKRELGVLF